MKFDALYQQSLALWPDEIEIYDGERSEMDYNDITFIRLSLTYDKAAADAQEFGEWYDLMTWIIFKNLHTLAKTGFKRKKPTVAKTDLDATVLKTDLLANLQLAGYETMLAEFERNN